MIGSEIALAIAALALVLAAWALLRTRTPPQQRVVNELRATVEELVVDVESLHQRLNKRTREESLGRARDAHEERRKRRDVLEEQAAALLQSQQQKPPPPADPKAARVELRRRVLGMH